MEISVQTFLWLRDKGGLSSTCAMPSEVNGMVAITADGLSEVASGLPVLRVLHRYCCNRFDVPKDIMPLVPNTLHGKITAKGKDFISPEAAREHNWNAVKKIVKEQLNCELNEEQVGLIQKQADALEALLVVKCVYDLVREYRSQEKHAKENHKALSQNPLAAQVKELLTSKSTSSTKSFRTRRTSTSPACRK